MDVIFLTSPFSPRLPVICRRWYNPEAMNLELFEKLVAEAYERLPKVFLERLENVAVVVEDWPDPATMRAVRVSSPYQLLGFYHGVPQTVRTKDYGLVPPDRISIYRRPIEVRCRTVEETRRLVERVLWHEIAHHFGISDERLDEIGAY
jgi:predicted Zn-dependent protease with MMP-like domain